MVSALKKGNDDQTPWTPAINLAMGWAASLRELEDEGLENRWNRCKTLADGVRRLFSDLGFMLLADAGQQSDTVTAIMYPEGMNDSWRSKLKDEYERSNRRQRSPQEQDVPGWKYGYDHHRRDD